MEKYTDFEKIGEGSFGSVHRAKDSQTGEIVAIKVFHNAVPEVARSAVREARFLAESCHCNITALKEAYQSSSGRVYLVLEYAHHVLSHQLKSHRKGLPTVAVRSIIFQLLQALHYLHSKGIMHRDCKPANILITNDGMVKLCDFGFARYAAGGAPKDMPDEPLTSYVITRWYRPPEVLAGQPYGCAVDVWAVGCILAEMLTGQPLFPGSSAIEQMYLEHIGLGGLTQEQQVVLQAHDGFAGAQADADKRSAASGTVFTRLAPLMSRSMMAFFRACLAPDPSQRATAKDLLDTPFIKEGAWEVATPSKMPAPAVEASAAPAGGEGKPAGAGRTRPSAAGPPDAAQVRSALRRQASASAIQAGSKGLALQQRQGPTVTQRTARDFALGAESEDDPDDLQRLASTLPPGEALFASGDEAAGDDQLGYVLPCRG